MDERLLIIIEPAVHHLKAIHQPLRIISKIRFPVTEFMVINSCLQRFFIDPPIHTLSEYIFNHLDKSVFLLLIRVLRYDGKNRLVDPIVIGSHNVLSDPRICKRFLKRRSRCGQ